MSDKYLISITELKLLNDRLEKELHELKIHRHKEFEAGVKTGYQKRLDEESDIKPALDRKKRWEMGEGE